MHDLPDEPSKRDRVIAVGSPWMKVGFGNLEPRNDLVPVENVGEIVDQRCGLVEPRLVGEHLEALAPVELWDLGANTGEFSRLACERGIRTVSFDQDPACADRSAASMKR